VPVALRTAVERLSDLGVRLNGLIVPGASIEGALTHHTFNLVIQNDHETYKLSLVGSATAVRFNGHYLLLCTKHQLHGWEPERVSMLMDDGSILVSSGGVRFYQSSADTDAYDIAAFDFGGAVADFPELARRFFELIQVPPSVLKLDVVAVLLSGFPASDHDYALADNRLGLARRCVICFPDGQSADSDLMRLRAEVAMTVSAAGMSGGGAFVVQIEEGGLSAYFAGIILRGSNEYFHVLKPGFVIAFLKSAFC
jgi:hypothetical protein